MNGYQATFDTSAALLVIAAVLAILAARAAAQAIIIPLLQKQGGGVIVDTFLGQGSNASPAEQPTAHLGTELIGLTKRAALEYASRGICINAVCPRDDQYANGCGHVG
jgi:NAD(P)-dependent dehydrogenase (short-subunit alcohol dehydrogenase family)